MFGSDLVMYDEEFKLIDAELQRLLAQANAKVVFVVDKNGQLIAATGGMAKLLGEKEFSFSFTKASATTSIFPSSDRG